MYTKFKIKTHTKSKLKEKKFVGFCFKSLRIVWIKNNNFKFHLIDGYSFYLREILFGCFLLLTFHVETSEQHWHRKNRPQPEKANKKIVIEMRVWFCGPSLTSRCNDALRMERYGFDSSFFFFSSVCYDERVRARFLGYKTLLMPIVAHASRLHTHQDKRRYEKTAKRGREKNSRRCVQLPNVHTYTQFVRPRTYSTNPKKKVHCKASYLVRAGYSVFEMKESHSTVMIDCNVWVSMCILRVTLRPYYA